ncbi:MAG: hypothetical protein KDD19_17960 [Phaeodactylibacter sp.]|nr:hypothetical protein [Phaeodactylibacter sp.]MCB9052108.1 hypothetical protein [Lewinellaceae bacterium]
MLRSLIKLAAFLVAGILVYNYFFGTAEEKAQSKEIFSDIKDLTKSAVGLLKSERQKFDEGKYDDAVDKIGGLIDNLKGKAEKLEDNRELLDQIADLQSQQRSLETKLGSPGVQSYGNEGQRVVADSAQRREIEDDWKTLVEKTERVMQEMDRRADSGQ